MQTSHRALPKQKQKQEARQVADVAAGRALHTGGQGAMTGNERRFGSHKRNAATLALHDVHHGACRREPPYGSCACRDDREKLERVMLQLDRILVSYWIVRNWDLEAAGCEGAVGDRCVNPLY